MSVETVFCNVPWFEVHINADGTYHSCGAQPNTITGTPDAGIYNVVDMLIESWVNSEHQKAARLEKLSGIKNSLCNMCYAEDLAGVSSKRARENLKSKIYPLHFTKTYNKSPDLIHFNYSKSNNGLTDILRPVSYHMSLGNECNLACRMCHPAYSSKLASLEIQSGSYNGPARLNWTDNDSVWNQVVETICSTENLKFIHIIGGEPLMNPKFEELIDRLISAGKTNIYFGFTTNGTKFSYELVEKLSAFNQVDIGISVECMGPLNDLIRRGSSTEKVLENIDLYLKFRKQGHFYVTLRVVPSALSVHTLYELYEWAVSRQLDVMQNLLTYPPYQQIQQLPENIKQKLITQYQNWSFSDPASGLHDPRDPVKFKEHIDTQIKAIIKALTTPNDPALTKELYTKLKLWNWLDSAEIAKYFIMANQA